MGIESINTLKGLITKPNRVMDKKSDSKNKKKSKKSTAPERKLADESEKDLNTIDIVV